MQPVTSTSRRIPLWLIFLAFFAALYLTHYTLLRLPYYWDECAYYIPAAYDFFQTGTIIRQSAVANIHPPLPSILLSIWWHLFGFSPLATRTLICVFAAASLTAVFRLARTLATPSVAIVTALLTALYPIWFAQSTLAHADIFAAAFTLWALYYYLADEAGAPPFPKVSAGLIPLRVYRTYLAVALLFSLAALSKETAILTPAALAFLELVRAFRTTPRKPHLFRAAALAFSSIPSPPGTSTTGLALDSSSEMATFTTTPPPTWASSASSSPSIIACSTSPST